MANFRSTHLMIALLAFSICGCAGKTDDQKVERLCFNSQQKQAVLDAVERTLLDMHFTINKFDAQRGYVLTDPLPAAQFFEFWRDDVTNASAALEANIHNVRRIAEVNVSGSGEQLCLETAVAVERLSLSQYNYGGGRNKYDRFSGLRLDSGKRRLALPKSENEWILLGEDAELESLILQRIKEQVANLEVAER